MTHTIIIQTENNVDFELIKGLAQRLGLRVDEQHTTDIPADQEAAFRRLFGGWQSDETGDELAARLEASRNDYPSDVHL